MILKYGLDAELQLSEKNWKDKGVLSNTTKPAELQRVLLIFRGDYRTRTGHLQIANLTFYQMN